MRFEPLRPGMPAQTRRSRLPTSSQRPLGQHSLLRDWVGAWCVLKGIQLRVEFHVWKGVSRKRIAFGQGSDLG